MRNPVFALGLFLSAFPLAAERIDLSGDWNLVSMDCLANERGCIAARTLAELPVFLPQPSNLHSTYPWFFGRACIERSFELKGRLHEPVLMLGGVGSIHTVFLNKVFVGETGDDSRWQRGVISDAWNQPRRYAIPLALLHESNVLRICFIGLDEKIGVHRGPIMIGENDDLFTHQVFLEILFEHLPAGIAIYAAFVTLFFWVALFLRLLPRGFPPFAIGMSFYIVFSLYGTGFISGVPHLIYLKTYLSAGLATSFFNWLAYFQILGFRNPVRERLGLALFTFALGLHWIWPDIGSMIEFARIFHLLIVILFIAVTIFLIISYSRFPEMRGVLLFLIPSGAFGGIANFWDLLVRNYLLNGPYVSNYFAGMYVTMVLVMIAFLMKQARTEADTYRGRLRDDRVSVARQLHGAVGSDLSLLVLELHSLGHEFNHARVLGKRTQLILERLRHLVHFMGKSENLGTALETEIRDYVERIQSTGLFDVQLEIRTPEAVSAETSLQLHFVFHEWMSNVVRHSRARKIRIRWSTHSGAGFLTVADNGGGMARANAQGMGLANLGHYAKSMHGRVRLMSWPGTGTLFSFKVPLTASPADP